MWRLLSELQCYEMQLCVNVGTSARDNETHKNCKCFLVYNLFPSTQIIKNIFNAYVCLLFVCLFLLTSGQIGMAQIGMTQIGMTIKHNTIYMMRTLKINKWWDSFRRQYVISEALPPNLILNAELQRPWFQRLMRMLG